MKKTILYAAMFAVILILSSFTAVAKPDTAPGQRRKDYDNQKEFVLSVLSNILERLQNRSVNPLGLLKLVNGLILGAKFNGETDEEDEDDEFEVDAKGDYEGIIGEVIQFEGYAKGGVEPYNWSWDFGDGNTSTEQFPTHYYIEAKNYTVNLTVIDDNGSTASDETLARIENDFEADAGGDYEGIIGELIQFEGKAEKGIEPYVWFWDFGDGNTSTEQNPDHIYESTGTYTVTLTVTDNVGNTASDLAEVKIKSE